VAYLPAELISHILSFLTPTSLMQAELVSRSWNKAASSHHVWRNVFRQEYSHQQSSKLRATKKTQSAGLGKTLPNQDWKKMTLVRQALDRRWKDGKAAAIYLQGHTDSVYCVQFDEYVTSCVFHVVATN
jgi:F-box and WD-40 domain protein 1/11